jgi:hypothetical protein
MSVIYSGCANLLLFLQWQKISTNPWGKESDLTRDFEQWRDLCDLYDGFWKIRQNSDPALLGQAHVPLNMY